MPTVGRTASWLEAGGSSGRPSPARRCTVVKQMLYSWMMLGYRELKSSSSTMLSCRPLTGSSTRPPAYWGPLRLEAPASPAPADGCVAHSPV